MNVAAAVSAVHAAYAEADRLQMKRLHRPVQVFAQLDQVRDLGARRLLLEERQQGVDLVERSLTMRLAFGWIRGDHPLDPFWASLLRLSSNNDETGNNR